MSLWGSRGKLTINMLEEIYGQYVVPSPLYELPQQSMRPTTSATCKLTVKMAAKADLRMTMANVLPGAGQTRVVRD